MTAGGDAPQRPIPDASAFKNQDTLKPSGLTIKMIAGGVKFAYNTIDGLDRTLLASGAPRLSHMIELANLSSVIGNLLGAGIAKSSDGVFQRNGPHKYPDLLAKQEGASDIEIKMALETNKPKGHLAKAGYYLTCRYVLCDHAGRFIPGDAGRGDTVWIWELRFGYLDMDCFNLSNTPGDSGKTAVINGKGMARLTVIFCDLERCPFSKGGSTYREYSALYGGGSKLF